MSKASPGPLFLLAGRPKVMPRGNRPDPLLQQVMGRCGRAHPRIAYLGSASGDDRGFFKMIAALVKNAGASEVVLAPTADAKVDLGKTREILEGAEVILVSGGDVEEGMRVVDASLTPLLRTLYERGTVFIGLSAGSIMLSRQWIRWRDPDDDSTAEVFACLNFAPVLCDTHGEADGWEELHALMRLSQAGAIGHGIPSGAGLGVLPDGRLLALGEPVHRFEHGGHTVTRISDLELEDGGALAQTRG
jgi:cyanophycinase-like exopeptidase